MTISYQLRKTRGQHYIFIALYQGKDSELISTGEKIEGPQWNKKHRRPHDMNSQTAMVIEKIKEDIQRTRRRMIAQDMPVTPFSLKEEYRKSCNQVRDEQRDSDSKAKASRSSVTSLIEKWKAEGLDEYQDSTVAVVKTSINMFKTFISDRFPRLDRSELTLDVFREYSRFLETKRKVADSTHGKRIKHLRWFLAWAGLDDSLVKKIKIRTVTQDERNIFRLNMAELLALENVDVSRSAEMQKAKDMFLIGCYTGLRISDIKRISPHRIRNGAIDITQKKNRKLNSVPLLPQLKGILLRYNYCAPKIAEQQVNESIKEVCKEAGIDKPTFKKVKKAGKLIESLHPKHELITTHSAGKTFISLAGERWGLRPEEIAAIVGKDVKTILSYYLEPDVEVAKNKMIEAENRALMKIKPIVVLLILLASACSVEPEVVPIPNGSFAYEELGERLPFTPNRDVKSGIVCEKDWPWRIGVHSSFFPSASQHTMTYKFWPDRGLTTVVGPNYNPATSTSFGSTPVNIQISIENRGTTPIKFSTNGGSSWTSIDRGGSPAFVWFYFPKKPDPCVAATEAQLTHTTSVMFKSTGCPPGGNSFSVRVNINAVSGGYGYHTAAYATGPIGGWSSGWNWNPPSNPCSFTL